MDAARVIEVIRQESVLIDRAGLVSLYGAVLRLAGLGVGGVLYQAGRQAGMQGARLLQERLGLQGEDLVEAARIAFEAAQWGEARWQREDATIRVEVTHSVLAEGLRPQRKPVCHPLAGYIAGFLEVALGRPVRVREIACAAVEGETCQFVTEAEGVSTLRRRSMFSAVRPATRADRSAILHLVREHRRAQMALDWWSLEEWLEAPTAWVVERMGRVIAFWLGIQVDSPVAWLRVAAVADGEDAPQLFRQLWPSMARALAAQGATEAVGVAYGEWLESVYPAAGFTRRTVVITLRKDDWRIPELPAVPVRVRRAMLEDIPRIAAVDRQAFEPLWWYGPTILTRAWHQVPYFIVAEAEGEIIGYAFADLYGVHGHIVRLAVHPAHQGRSVGARLLAESLRYLIDLGAYPITLNTQIENRISQALYRRFGFHPTGQEVSIWSCALR